jgi:hypothetical protein
MRGLDFAAENEITEPAWMAHAVEGCSQIEPRI